MKIKPFRVAFPDMHLVDSPDKYCSEIKFKYLGQQKKGVYQEAPKEAFYIYQIESGGRKHIGLVVLNDVSDFFAGKVIQHEHTLSEKEKQHMDLILEWKAVLKPILLTYPEIPEISTWLHDYVQHHYTFFNSRFEKRSQLHRIWAISKPSDIEMLQNLFAKHIQQAYIADGHHRTTTMAMLHRQLGGKRADLDLNHLFCAFFADTELDILDYNRVVDVLSDRTPLQFLAELSAVFEITHLPQARKPVAEHEIVLYLRKEWFALQWKANIIQEHSEEKVLFDASLLNTHVLDALLGIKDVRTDTRISYIEGSRGLRGVVKACGTGKLKAGFVLYPVSFQNLMRVADTGGSLPPKSTYFEPRLKSGVLVHDLRLKSSSEG